MATASRPFGVTLVAIIAWLSGAWNLIQGIVDLIQGFVTWNVVTAWLLIIIGALTILVSLALFRGDPSARLIVTIVFVVSAGIGISAVVAGGPLWAALPSILLDVLGIVLLYTPRANAFFRN